MRAIIIEDKDAKDLLRRLELEVFRDLVLYDVPSMEAWHSLPEGTRKTLVEALHRKFHHKVVCWLQDQGASTIST